MTPSPAASAELEELLRFREQERREVEASLAAERVRTLEAARRRMEAAWAHHLEAGRRPWRAEVVSRFFGRRPSTLLCWERDERRMRRSLDQQGYDVVAIEPWSGPMPDPITGRLPMTESTNTDEGDMNAKPDTNHKLTSAQAAALKLLRESKSGAMYLGNRTWAEIGTIHHGVAKVLARLGYCSIGLGADGRVARLVEPQPEPPSPAAPAAPYPGVPVSADGYPVAWARRSPAGAMPALPALRLEMTADASAAVRAIETAQEKLLTRAQRAVLRFVREHPGATAVDVWAGVKKGSISSPHWALNHLEALESGRLIVGTGRPGSYERTWKIRDAAAAPEPIRFKVRVYHSLERGFRFEAWVPAAPMALVDEFTWASPYAEGDQAINHALEQVYSMHQGESIASRSAERRIRSLSVGDVVQLDDQAYACEPAFGWRAIDAAELTLPLERRQ